MSEKKLSTHQILLNKFPANECVLLKEVSNASGFSRSRSLDWMVVNLWPSRGLFVTGIEEKSGRGDWLKELKDPKKQEDHFKYCDFFYLLTTNENVAKLGEIPETWGWYHIKGNRIYTMKEAPKLKPEPIDRSFMCAMLRRAADKGSYVLRESIQDEIQQAKKSERELAELRFNNSLNEHKKLKQEVDEFERHSGITIHKRWDNNPQKIGEAVKLIVSDGVEKYENELSRIQEVAKKLYENIANTLEKIKA